MAKARRAGSVYTEIRARLDKLEKDYGNARRKTNNVAKAMQDRLNKLNFNKPAESFKRFQTILAAGLAGSALVSFQKLVNAASDLEEVTSKFNVVFAGQQQLVNQWATTLIDSYAMSTKEAKEYLAAIQDLLVPMGLNAKEAAKMSFEVVKLSADLGSFNNMRTADVMRDIQSALVGNFETMKKYGVVLNATSVQQRALAEGFASTKRELTAADKALAAFLIMLEDTKAAQGDMIRTADSYANTLKRFNARIEDITATIGEKFLPIATDFLQSLLELDAIGQKIFGGDLKKNIDENYKEPTEAINRQLEYQQKLLEKLGATGSKAYQEVASRIEKVRSALDDVAIARANIWDVEFRHAQLVKNMKIPGIEDDKKPLPKPSKKPDFPLMTGAPATVEQFRMLEKIRESYRVTTEKMEDYTVDFSDSVVSEWKTIDDRASATIYNMTDAITSFSETAKFSFKGFASSVISDLIRIQTRTSLTDLFNLVKGSFAPNYAPAHVGAGGTTAFGMQHGGYLGEGVVGIGRRSGASYEFHPNEYVTPANKMGGNNITINLRNETGVPMEAEQQPIVWDHERMIADVIIKRKTVSRGFRDAIRL